MAVDFAASWIQNGNTFNFVDPYGIDDMEDGGFTLEIPEQQYSGADGAYQDFSYAKPRDVTLNGTMITNPMSAQTLRNQFDTMAQAFTKGAFGQLYSPNSDRLLNCRVAQFNCPKPYEGIPTMPWRLGFRAADPYYYDSFAQAPITLNSGTNTFNVGGSASALPIVTITVSEIAANWDVIVTLTPWVSDYFSFMPLVITIPSVSAGGQGNGTYQVNCQSTPPTLIYNNYLDMTPFVTGSFLEFATGANQLNLNISTQINSGPNITGVVDVTMQWTQRWTTAF